MKTMLNMMAMLLVTFTFSAHAKGHVSESAVQVAPHAGEFGLGGMIGTIVSGTGKYWLSDKSALDFGLGFVEGSWIIVYGDYLWHIPKVFGTNSKWGRESSLYFGGGGGFGSWHGDGACGHWGCNWDEDRHDSRSGTGIFIRGVSGVEWYPQHTRFAVFGEAGPSIMISPGTWMTIDVGVGGRYFF